MEHYSAIKSNTFESVIMRWMKLEPIIQNEVIQKGKTPIEYAAAAAKSLQLCPTLCDPIDGSPLPSNSRPWDSPGQEYWSGLPFPSPVHESEK